MVRFLQDKILQAKQRRAFSNNPKKDLVNVKIDYHCRKLAGSQLRENTHRAQQRIWEQ